MQCANQPDAKWNNTCIAIVTANVEHCISFILRSWCSLSVYVTCQCGSCHPLRVKYRWNSTPGHLDCLCFFPSIAWKPDSIIHLLESDAKYLVASTIYHVFTWPMFLFVEPPVSVIFSVLVGTVETPIGASWVDPPVENNYPKEDNSTTVITVRGTLDFLDVLQVRGPGAANQIMDDVLFQMSRLERYIPIHGSSYITYITHDDFRVPYLSGVCSWRFLMLLIHFGRYRWVRWVTKSWKLSNIFDPAHCEIWTWFEKITDSKNRTWY